jgi:hypothetical protein
MRNNLPALLLGKEGTALFMLRYELLNSPLYKGTSLPAGRDTEGY